MSATRIYCLANDVGLRLASIIGIPHEGLKEISVEVVSKANDCVRINCAFTKIMTDKIMTEGNSIVEIIEELGKEAIDEPN